MARVYRNSIITLAATFPKDPSTGGPGVLFGDRPSRLPKVCKFEPRLSHKQRAEIGPADQLYAIYSTDEHELREADQMNIEWYPEPRAGALQEDFLSCRKLIFSQQMYWTCVSHKACEVNPTGTSIIMQDWKRTPGFQYSVFRAAISELDQASPTRPPTDLIYSAWRQIVELYTHQCLGFDSDKLGTISSLARVAEAGLKDIFVFGMWKNRLWEELSWTTAVKINPNDSPIAVPSPSVRADNSRIPTWSWASVRGPVKWWNLHGTRESRMEIVPWMAPNTTSSAVLTLKGYCLKLYSTFEDGLYYLSAQPGASKKWPWYPDIGLDHSAHATGKIRLFCLVLAHSASMGQLLNTYHLLCLLPTESKGQYERIGVCDWPGKAPDDERFFSKIGQKTIRIV